MSFQEQNLLQQLKEIYAKYFKITSLKLSQQKKINQKNCDFQYQQPEFQQIDFGPAQICSFYFQLHQNCLIIGQKAFDRYYQYAFKILKNPKKYGVQNSLIASDLILAMNGQNDRAWNMKNKQGQQYLSLKWQLKFNSIICLRCKKSSSYYQYRLKLIENQLNVIYKHNELKQDKEIFQIHERQISLIHKILGKFFRNYYCWMYRVKVIKLLSQTINFNNKNQSLIDQSSQQDHNNLSKIGQDAKNLAPVTYKQLLNKQSQAIHKFLQKYSNDYSGYSYLITFFQRYYFIPQDQSHINEIQQQLPQKTITFCKWQLNQIKQKQLKWIQQMVVYCEVVYENKLDYKHLVMYKEYMSKK